VIWLFEGEIWQQQPFWQQASPLPLIIHQIQRPWQQLSWQQASEQVRQLF